MKEEVIVFIDDGFLAKLSKYFGGGNYLKFDRIQFAINIAKKQGFNCQHIFYFLAPPFQGNNPNLEETKRCQNHEKFVNKLSQNPLITIREGRCQRIKNSQGEFVYKQKAVDSLLIIDFVSLPMDYPQIKKVILVASDRDFVPAVEKLKKAGIEVILYTYYVKKRDTGLSRSNYLMKAVSRYEKITKEDFDNSPLIKKEIDTYEKK